MVGRRDFIRAGLSVAAASSVGPLLTEAVEGAPRGAPQAPAAVARGPRPVRVRGRVRAGSAGVASVPVTDGLSIVRTDADGHFTLVADGYQPFVYLSMPDGYELPRSEHGTVVMHRPLVAGAGDEMEVLFELTPRHSPGDRYVCLVLPDVQTQDMEDMTRFHRDTVPDVRAWLSGHDGRPVFGLALGDIMYDRLELYPEYERAVREMGVPFFQAVGNHDLDMAARSAERAVSTFMRHFGPPYYSFDMGAIHYVVLQDVLWHGTGYVGYLDERQLRWLEADLALVEAGCPVVVFLHIPLLSARYRREGASTPNPGTSVNNRPALYRMLEPYTAHVVSGHTHENEHVFEGGVHEHVHGTVCGAWWTGPICHDGTPAGYGIFEAAGEELRWTYKAVGQPLDHQMRLYAPGADRSAPDELVANVWNWDPAWRVEWVADGEPRGPMARRIGLDPLSVELHKGEKLPAKRPWVEPRPTDHLFYAPVAATVREVEVRVTDRFGRDYTERWHRRSATGR